MTPVATLPTLPKPQHPLVARCDYVTSGWQVISLCVVDTPKGRQVRLYAWHRDGNAPWKVSLTHLSVRNLDLSRIAEDAVVLAAKWGVQLAWSPAPTGPTKPTAGNPIPSTAPPPTCSRVSQPSCPQCGSDAQPLGYGVGPLPPDSNVLIAASYFSALSPLWCCVNCQYRWGALHGE
jgi:hypothetical protein